MTAWAQNLVRCFTSRIVLRLMDAHGLSTIENEYVIYKMKSLFFLSCLRGLRSSLRWYSWAQNCACLCWSTWNFTSDLIKTDKKQPQNIPFFKLITWIFLVDWSMESKSGQAVAWDLTEFFRTVGEKLVSIIGLLKVKIRLSYMLGIFDFLSYADLQVVKAYNGNPPHFLEQPDWP